MEGVSSHNLSQNTSRTKMPLEVIFPSDSPMNNHSISAYGKNISGKFALAHFNPTNNKILKNRNKIFIYRTSSLWQKQNGFQLQIAAIILPLI